MEQIAFKMLLNPDQAEVYKKRHDEIWDDLVVLLKDAGISDYSIFLDPETNILFAVLKRIKDHRMEELLNMKLCSVGGLSWEISWRPKKMEPCCETLEFMFHMP